MVVDRTVNTEGRQSDEMGIQSSEAYDIPSRRWNDDLHASGEKRTGEEDRPPDGIDERRCQAREAHIASDMVCAVRKAVDLAAKLA